MEVMDVVLATVQDVSALVGQHPWYSALLGLFLFVALIRFYSRLTLGTWNVKQDMTGKTVLITGATSGIGKETAFDMARRNARVLMACRNMGKANKLAREIQETTGNPNVIVKSLNLCSFESVRECAKNINEKEENLHVLINNAGITGYEHIVTEDGCDIVMQANHFGHFLFTLLLLDLLKKSSPSRIINVSSIAHRFATLDLDDLNNEKGKLSNVYGRSKLANILFTTELAERLRGTGITVNALHPGAVNTDLLNKKTMGNLRYTIAKTIFLIGGKSPEEGAQTTIRLAVDPSLEETTGKYFSDCKEADVSKEAQDRTKAKKLFELSEKIVGETFRKPS